LIYNHTASWSQATPTQNTWYAVTDFILALPTGGVWEIEFGAVPYGAKAGIHTCLLTCADGSAEEDDNKYTVFHYSPDANDTHDYLTKSFQRTFASNVTLYMNAKATYAAQDAIYVYSTESAGYLKARRVA